MSTHLAQRIVPPGAYYGTSVGEVGDLLAGLALTLRWPMTDLDRKARIARAIREAREERGLSRPELAALVGVSRSAVNDWENETSLPSLLHLGPLVDALRVDPDLFAHPPEIAVSPVRRYLRPDEERVVEQAAQLAVDGAPPRPRRAAR